MTIFENAAHVPMVFALPNGLTGKTCSRTVELVDLYPTLADLAGVPAPAKLDGKSIRSLIENPTAEWDVPAITQVLHGKAMGYSLRSEKWRYTEVWTTARKAASFRRRGERSQRIA